MRTVSYERGTPQCTRAQPRNVNPVYYTGKSYQDPQEGDGDILSYHGPMPSSGEGVKFDPTEVLGRSWGPTVGRMRLVATQGMRPRAHVREGHLTDAPVPVSQRSLCLTHSIHLKVYITDFSFCPRRAHLKLPRPLSNSSRT